MTSSNPYEKVCDCSRFAAVLPENASYTSCAYPVGFCVSTRYCVVTPATVIVYDAHFASRMLLRDGDGNRVSKTVAGVTTQYLVDTQNPTGYAQVVYEAFSGSTAANREQSHTFSYGLELVNEARSYVVNGQSANSLICFDYDGHGSVRALTDPTGAVTDTYDYDAFGNLIHSTGTTPNNYLFPGEQFDPDLGLYYNRARYLNTTTGRFWPRDSFAA